MASWKALEQETPRITEGDRVLKRMSRDLAQGGIDGLEELFAQAGPLPLVPKTLLRRPPRRAEGSSPLLRLTADPAKDVIPRNADRANTVEFIKATVKLLALGWRNRHGFGCRREAVPNLLQQLKPLLGAKARDIDGVH
jgi:hypothetical protein